MTAVLRVLWFLAMLAAPVHAQSKVAMLPLDAGKSLELYGRPVASELSKALAAGDLVVVVVGAKATVPADARLIIDGTITQGAGTSIALAIRVRNPLDGKVLDTLSATAPDLANIDRAAADLATRVVPVVKARLAAFDVAPPPAEPPVVGAPPAPRPPSPAKLAINVAGDAALAAALEPAVAARAEGATGAALQLEIRGYQVEPGAVPLARARVRAVISAAGRTVFDRVIVTDTIVGDKAMAPAALAARVAREVLAILHPHLRRTVSGWR